MTYDEAKEFLTKLPETIQYPAPSNLLDPIMLWLQQGISTGDGICDDPTNHHRDIARLVVLSKLALHASHELLPCKDSTHVRDSLNGLAFWCIDRVVWCSDAEDVAEELIDSVSKG